MDKKGLLIGIDFAQDFTKVCYFNERRGQVENVMAARAELGILIPTVLSFDEENQNWLIGEQAQNFSSETGAFLFTDILTGTLAQRSGSINSKTMPYAVLLSVFFEKIIELARRGSGIFPVSRINVAMRRVNLEIKEVIEQAFTDAGVEKDRIHIINYPESFAYFILQQDKEIQKDGALLFDFSKDGFFLNRFTISKEKNGNTIFVSEQNYSMEFSLKDEENIVLRPRMDEKLEALYESVKGEDEKAGIYFTGEGFDELWFTGTLKNISASRKAFRGNNIYAKGACLKGLLQEEKTAGSFDVICRPKTRAYICVEARYRGQAQTIVLSPAAVNWYEASGTADFILDESRIINFKAVSLLGKEETGISFNLSSFPVRPPKTTRVRVSAAYINEYECEICVSDLGFGSFFPSSGRQIRKILNLEGYI